ncbi:MAG: Type II secretion system F domain protein [Candidatus Roizmanbacteria bacterium GW2011_GWC2_37_13]|uniref:Type II secretion system F domain protein n=1 Tax=Candidatus Roizmanbacteria bacterium GW2011_GWC2_37_13 TaxID=1618486 RepID=A0A0G0JC34_9BACT|nr:MAG: Type II secretion system F domain protein [Candidatus Roizmanbacteria bacterium GW2011_GWC1_37_12]KKQ25706.1 MAG: Type II secretion system F domain protein [Candidatus Roizmanbacteria bacterium GW2011_GWC2_37_13]
MFFKYKALKGTNTVERQIEAASVASVIDYLQKNDYFPISVTEVKEKEDGIFSSLTSKVTFNDIVDFTRQTAIMLNAGLTIIDSLEILKKQLVKPGMRKMIIDIDGTIKAGGSFSSALKKYPSNFSGLYIALVKSGEASGKLGEILLRLADNLEKEREFKSKLKGALIYPVLIMVGMFVVMFIMITFVIPKLLGLYQDFNVELPITTKILIMISSFSVHFWPLMIIGVFGGSYFLKKYLQTKKGKHSFDQLTLKLPVIGKVVAVSALVDSTRTLAILIGAGVSILEALSIIIETTDNLIYQRAFIDVSRKVEKGQSLGASLDQQGIFPPILVQMSQVGEQTGNLDDTLLRLSKYFEMESEISIKAMTTLIEPAILVVLGFGVGFLVLSVITPIYNLTSSFK